MKKILSLITVITIFFSAIIPICAEDNAINTIHSDLECCTEETQVVPLAEVECTYYNGKHVMYPYGPCNIRNASGSTIRYTAWGLYKCLCGSVVICQGFPPTGAICYYFETVEGNYFTHDNVSLYDTDATPFYSSSTSLPHVTFKVWD